MSEPDTQQPRSDVPFDEPSREILSPQPTQAGFAASTPLERRGMGEQTHAAGPSAHVPAPSASPPPPGLAAGLQSASHLTIPLSSRATPPTVFRPRDLITSVIAVLAIVGLLALLLARILAAQHTMTTLVATNAAHHSNATLAAAGPILGHPAPNFTLTVWNAAPGAARTISLAALAGHPVVVNFWAPWCGPCQQEAPLLAAAAHSDTAQGVVFLGVAFDTNQHDVATFLQRYGIAYPCGPDATGAIASAYGLPGIPVTVFINRRGIITQKSIGPLTAASLASFLQAITH